MFSPDGRTLVTASTSGGVALWEVATGGRRLTAPLAKDYRAYSAALSPDGRWLAAGTARDGPRYDVAVHLWNLETDAAPAIRRGHRSSVGEMRFAPDSKTLATVSADATGLIWEVPASSASVRVSVDAETAWAELARPDAERAWRFIRQLVAQPEAAVKLLSAKLAVKPPAPEQRVKELIALLDSPKFAERDAAMKELKRLGQASAPALRQALTANPSLELRRRLETLLAPLQVAPLEQVRALEVLEQIGSPAARTLLQTVADRDDADPVAVEARAALLRLARRPIVP